MCVNHLDLQLLNCWSLSSSLVSSPLCLCSHLAHGVNNVAQAELKSDLNGVYAGMESARNWNNGYPDLVDGAVFDGNSETKSVFVQSDK